MPSIVTNRAVEDHLFELLCGEVRTGQSLLAGTDTEVTICCRQLRIWGMEASRNPQSFLVTGMRLPTSSPQDFSALAPDNSRRYLSATLAEASSVLGKGYTISGPTSLDTLTSINEDILGDRPQVTSRVWGEQEPILNSPEIDPGLQWDFLRASCLNPFRPLSL